MWCSTTHGATRRLSRHCSAWSPMVIRGQSSWLGTHPNGPTTLGDGRPLRALTGELPYLLKVLAAAQPLSLQTHPNAEQASDGRPRVLRRPESQAGAALRADPFEALCGVRPMDATLELLHELDLHAALRLLTADDISAVVEGLYRGTIDPQPAIDACATSERVEARWVRHLHKLYPDDPSVAVTLLLNLVELSPGDTIRLDAGNLHAYLHGAGIELMGASDNVVRGGLTVKAGRCRRAVACVRPNSARPTGRRGRRRLPTQRRRATGATRNRRHPPRGRPRGLDRPQRRGVVPGPRRRAPRDESAPTSSPADAASSRRRSTTP